jgi:signal transduction histidine kinase/ligand-binding sensor domain-containing protein/DNA-binding response OmpR family regulator
VTRGPVKLLAMVLLCAPAWGLDPKLALTQLGHDVWTTSNGLPHDSVRAIAQTAEGYLWFATTDGLARFDGVDFTVFNESNTPLLKRNTVISLQAAPDGSLWMGTGNGALLHYRDGGFEKVEGPGLASASIRALLMDSRGVLWIAGDGGVTRLVGGRGIPVFTGGWEANVHVMLEYPAGKVWVGANDGLHRFEGGVERVFTTKDGLPDNSIWGLAGAGDALWIGTHTGGLMEYRQGRFRTYGQRDGFTPSGILALLSDRDGALWIATDGGGLSRLAEGKFSSYQTRDGLSNQIIRCLYEDNEGSVWMGTAGGGINRFKEYRVTMRTMREGLPSDSVRSIQQDSSGDIWLGTTNGIARLRTSGDLVVYGSKDEPSRNLMWPVIRDRHGNLWAGSEDGVLRKFRGEPTGQPQREWRFTRPIRLLFEQRDGTVWAATGDSLIRFEGDSMVVFGKGQGLAAVPVTAMAEGVDGAIWVGTALGVQRLDGGQFGPVLTRPGPRQMVLCMHADAAGHLWVVTVAGLNRIAGTHFTPYTASQGMPESGLASIVEDDDGYFWFPGREMLRVSRADLDAVAEGRKRAVDPEKFGKAAGMRIGSEFAFGATPAVWKGRGNKLYFATYGGMVEIDVARVTVNRRPPPVLIERVTDDRQKPIGAGGWIRAGSNLEFHYTALTFLFPEFTQFRYKLEGFDADWVEAGNRRTAFYTNIPPGSYRFRVVARNMNSTWNETGASFALEARPRFYQTFWFAALCVLAACSAGVGYYRIRVGELRRSERRLVERVGERTAELRREVGVRQRAEEAAHAAEESAQAANRAKSEFLANMSHEIRTPLNGVLGVTELLVDTETVPERRAYLGMVKNSGESLLGIINDILDFSKIEAGKLDLDPVDFDLPALLDQTVKSFSLSAGQKEIELICQTHDVPGMVVGDPTRLRQVLTNLLGNALKFTANGEIVVRAQVASQDGDTMMVQFSVRDTGVGIPVEKQQQIFEPFAQADSSTTRKYGGTGLGLTVCLRLVEMMGGKLWVESEPGHGSCFHFTARLGVSKKQRGSQPAERNLQDMAVLVVDDNATNLLVLQEMLANWGMQVRAESGAKAALAFAQAAADAGSPLPLVITDAHMPQEDGFDLARQLRQNPRCAGAAIIMLTSASQSGDSARCRELGLAAHLTKPVSSWDLRQLICGVLDRDAEEPPAPEPAAGGLPGKARSAASLKILVAEDNPINQMVAVRLLEKRAHRVTVAATGREAVAAVERERFDLVLMDVQMPEMDGYEATAAIRQAEAGTGRHLPIFALTARAMKGDEERCRLAGMDGYLPKPINSADLYAIVDGCSPVACPAELAR